MVSTSDIAAFYTKRLKILLSSASIPVYISVVIVAFRFALRLSLVTASDRLISNLTSKSSSNDSIQSDFRFINFLSSRTDSSFFIFGLLFNCLILLYLCVSCLQFLRKSFNKEPSTQSSSSIDSPDEKARGGAQPQLNKLQKTFSFLFMTYNSLFLIPQATLTFLSTSYIWPLNLALTSFICLLCWMNGYEYSFLSQNGLARGISRVECLTFICDFLSSYFFSTSNSQGLLSSLLLSSCLSLFHHVVGAPYFAESVQQTSIVSAFTQSLMVGIMFFAEMISPSTPVIISFIMLFPCAVLCGLQVHRKQFEDARSAFVLAMTEGTPIENINVKGVEIYLRYLCEKTKMIFQFTDLYVNLSRAEVLSTIIAMKAKELSSSNVLSPHPASSSIPSELQTFLSLESQQEIIVEYIRGQLKWINDNQQNSHFRYSYLSFLTDIYGKRAVAFLEIFSAMTTSNRGANLHSGGSSSKLSSFSPSTTSPSHSLFTEQSLRFILYQAETRFKQQKFANDNLNVLSIIYYDNKLGENQQLLEQCLESKKDVLNLLSQSFIDLNIFKLQAQLLIKKRDDLALRLRECTKEDHKGAILKEQIFSFIMYLCMEDATPSDFFFKSKTQQSLRLGGLNHRRRKHYHRGVSDSDVYWSSRYGIVFITLIRNIGEIIGASNNVSSLFEFGKSQLIGRNINMLIPPIIAIRHHMILTGFKRRGANNHMFNNFRFVLAQNKRGFIIPVLLKLKIELLGSDDFGISGIFKSISEKYLYLIVSEAFTIAGISEKFFKDVLAQSFTLNEARSFNVNKIIPMFLATIHLQQEQRLKDDDTPQPIQQQSFETFMVVNTSREGIYLLSSLTSSIEKDVKDIRLATSDIYKIVYKIEGHTDYGFTYYNVIFYQCEKVTPSQSEEYTDTVLSLLSQFREVYDISINIINDVKEQLVKIIGHPIYNDDDNADDEELNQQQLAFEITEQDSMVMLNSNYHIAEEEGVNNKDIQNTEGEGEPLHVTNMQKQFSEDKMRTQHDHWRQRRLDSSRSMQMISERGELENDLIDYNGGEGALFETSDNLIKPTDIAVETSNVLYRVAALPKSKYYPEQPQSEAYSTSSSSSKGAEKQYINKVRLNELLRSSSSLKRASQQSVAKKTTVQNGNVALQRILTVSASKVSPIQRSFSQSQVTTQTKMDVHVNKNRAQIKRQQSSRDSEEGHREKQRPISSEIFKQYDSKARQHMRQLKTQPEEHHGNISSKSNSSSSSSDSDVQLYLQRKQQARASGIVFSQRLSQKRESLSGLRQIKSTSFQEFTSPTIEPAAVTSPGVITTANYIAAAAAASSRSPLQRGQRHNSININIQSLIANVQGQRRTQSTLPADDDQTHHILDDSKNIILAANISSSRIATLPAATLSASCIISSHYLNTPETISSALVNFNNNSSNTIPSLIMKNKTTAMSLEEISFEERKFSSPLIQVDRSTIVQMTSSRQIGSTGSGARISQLQSQNIANSSSINGQVKQQQQVVVVEEASQPGAAVVIEEQEDFPSSSDGRDDSERLSVKREERKRRQRGYGTAGGSHFQGGQKEKVVDLVVDDPDDGRSQSSEASRRTKYFERQILNQIKSKHRDKLTATVQLIGFLILLAIALSMTYMYASVTTDLSQMNVNLGYIDWTASVKSSILLTIKCSAYLKFLTANPFAAATTTLNSFKAATLTAMLASYTTLTSDLLIASAKDINSIRLFSEIQVREVPYSRLTSAGSAFTWSLDNLQSLRLSQALHVTESQLYRVANQFDDRELSNEGSLMLNVTPQVNLLDEINDELNAGRSQREGRLNTLMKGVLIVVLSLTGVFALSIFPLFLTVSAKNAKITAMFTTLSPDVLLKQHQKLAQYVVDRSSEQMHSQSEARLTQRTAVLLSQVFVEKKRAISDSHNAKIIQTKFVFTAAAFFLLIAVAPIAVYLLTQHFTKEINYNLTLINQLEGLRASSIAHLEVNYVIAFKKLIPSIYPTVDETAFIQTASSMIEKTAMLMSDLRILMNGERNFTRIYSEVFDKIIFPILQGDACATVRFSMVLTEALCSTPRAGVFNKGLILGLTDIQIVYEDWLSLLQVTDAAEYISKLQSYSAQNTFEDIDAFHSVLSSLVLICNKFIKQTNQDYYSEVSVFLKLIFAYAVLVIAAIFLVGWSRFCDALQIQLFETKQYFTIIHLSVLLSNPYFHSYLSSLARK